MQLDTLSPTPGRALSQPVGWFPRQRFQVQPSGEERLCRPAGLLPLSEPRPNPSSPLRAYPKNKCQPGCQL